MEVDIFDPISLKLEHTLERFKVLVTDLSYGTKDFSDHRDSLQLYIDMFGDVWCEMYHTIPLILKHTKMVYLPT